MYPLHLALLNVSTDAPHLLTVAWWVSSADSGIDNLVNFLSIPPNKTKFLPSVCLIHGLDFSAIPVSISAVSVGRLSNNIYLLDFKVAKWAVSFLTHSSNPF
jgi:hypothetical protein